MTVQYGGDSRSEERRNQRDSKVIGVRAASKDESKSGKGRNETIQGRVREEIQYPEKGIRKIPAGPFRQELQQTTIRAKSLHPQVCSTIAHVGQTPSIAAFP